MKSCAVVTYIYPGSLNYWDELIRSLKDQTYKDFDFIVFSDSVEENELELLNTRSFFYTLIGSPVDIRYQSLEILKKQNYAKYIFIDSDDTMTTNRVEVTQEKLDQYDLVTCDLNLMNEKGYVYEYKIWSSRLDTNFEFTYQFLNEKNIVGFGCTAIKSEILNTQLNLVGDPLAADWFLFYQLIFNRQVNCLFTSECQVNYRQYGNNEIGLKKITSERLKKILTVKQKHFNALKQLGIEIKEPAETRDIQKIEEYNVPNLFWWEIPTKKK